MIYDTDEIYKTYAQKASILGKTTIPKKKYLERLNRIICLRIYKFDASEINKSRNSISQVDKLLALSEVRSGEPLVRVSLKYNIDKVYLKKFKYRHLLDTKAFKSVGDDGITHLDYIRNNQWNDKENL